jgi:hypothetical protein
MKTSIKYIIASFLLLITQSYNYMATADTEKQKYRVVHSEEGFEIRFYQASILATVYSDAKTYRELAYPGFRKLAGYIFGSNESGTKISMTSPVHMEFSKAESSMSFVMPSSFSEENLPRPDDPAVKIEKTEDAYMAAISFGGYASDKKIRDYSDKLRTLLHEKGISWNGNFRYLGYNPPFQIFGRKNEIIVPVKWSEKSIQ